MQRIACVFRARILRVTLRFCNLCTSVVVAAQQVQECQMADGSPCAISSRDPRSAGMLINVLRIHRAQGCPPYLLLK